MFRFLGKNLQFHKRFLVDSPQFGFLIRFISIDSTNKHNSFTNKHNSFTISYLMNKCGLSYQKAISVPKRVHFETSTKPDSVLTFFRNNGFSDSHISKIIACRPQLLLSSVDKSLKPKFQFFISKGLCDSDLAKLMFGCPSLLIVSLEETIIPFYNLVKDMVGTDAKVITVFKGTMGVINAKVLASNISLLRDRNVPAPNIAKLLVLHPRVLLRNASCFSEMIEQVEKMEFNPSEYRFLLAMQVLILMSRSSFEAKFDVYRSWGLSSEEVQYAFRMNPICIMLSEKNIKSKMDYFVNKLGYTPSSLAKQPSSLLYSIERIVPRCSVIQVLVTNGQIEKRPSLCSVLNMTEDKFFKNFITKFEKEVPDLLNTYQEKVR